MGVTDAPPTTQLSENTGPRPDVQSRACLNCGVPLAGAYCAQCGQRDIPPYPSVRDLVIDAFWELSGWDGRFASTVRALVRRPGMLTREFLEGRRARYLSPLRLYLMASLVYFVLAAADAGRPDRGQEPNVHWPQATADRFNGDSIAACSASPRPSPVHSVDQNADPDPGKAAALTAEEKAQALKDAERAPALMRPFL